MSEIVEYVISQKHVVKKVQQELEDYKNQSIITQAKKGEELTAKLVVYNEAIKMMGDGIFDLEVENDTLRKQLGDIDERWLEESKEKNKLCYDNEGKNQIILGRMRKQYQKHLKTLK